MKIEEAYKTFITLMWNNIIKAYQSIFEIKYQVISRKETNRVVKSIFPNIVLNLSDEKFQITTWEFWKKFIEFDWTNHKKYITDFFDCDNFSGSFCSRAAEIFNLNSAGRFSCTVTTGKGEKISHRAVLILALDEKDEVCCYVYESQNDGWQKVDFAGQVIKIGDWSYSTVLSEFN